MKIEVSDEQLLLLDEALQPCQDIQGLNGPAGYMLMQELAGLEKAAEEITLGELAAAYQRAHKRYDAMYERLNSIGGE
jgi:hypothetical protein